MGGMVSHDFHARPIIYNNIAENSAIPKSFLKIRAPSGSVHGPHDALAPTIVFLIITRGLP